MRPINLNITANPNGTFSFQFDAIPYIFIPTNGLTGVNRNNHTAYGNTSVFADPHEYCDLSTCDLTLGAIEYCPNLGANVFYATVFAIYLIAQIYFGVRYKTRGYTIAITLGLIGEIVGYIGRILLWHNIFDPTGHYFLVYLVPLTIAPAFLSAGIYLCLSRIVIVYGQHISRFQPGTYTLIFCGCDILSLILQAIGGGIASTAHSQNKINLGVHIMIAGLGFQVFSLTLFGIFCTDFVRRVRQNHNSWLQSYSDLQDSRFFHTFLLGLCIATFCIFIRSIFRAVELSGGFHGTLANQQVTFMILEGAMIIIGSFCLTFLHPGPAFAGAWEQLHFTLRSKKTPNGEKTMEGPDTPESARLVFDPNANT